MTADIVGAILLSVIMLLLWAVWIEANDDD